MPSLILERLIVMVRWKEQDSELEQDSLGWGNAPSWLTAHSHIGDGSKVMAAHGRQVGGSKVIAWALVLAAHLDVQSK